MWIQLLAFSLLSITNSFQWISFVAIRSQAGQILDIQLSWIDQMTCIYMIVFVPCMIITPYLNSIQFAIKISAVLNLCGAVVKFIAVISGNSAAFGILVVGQVVNGISNAMFMAAPAEISRIWFPKELRSLATGLAVQANTFGSALGLLLSPISVFDLKSLQIFMAVVLGACAIALLIVFVFFKDPPNEFPSHAAEYKRIFDGNSKMKESSRFDFIREMWHYLMSSFDYICLTSSFGLIIGAANSAWATFLQALLYQAHPNDVQIGICGFLGLIAGMLGSVLWPYIAHKTKNYRLCLILMSFSVAVSLPIFCYFAYSPSFGFVEIDLITIFFNVHIGGMFSLVFEFAAEITFPISESFSSGIALASAQLLGFIIVETLTFSDASAYVISLTISILSVIGFLISCFVKNSLHRTEIESEKF